MGRFGGALASLSAVDLASLTLTELVRRTGLGEGDVDDVVLGQCYANGESPAIGRIAALDAGPRHRAYPASSSTAAAGPGLQAVLYAAGQVATGAAKVVVAGGAESMSQVEHYALGLRTGVRAGGVELMDRLDRARITAGGKDHPVPGGMLETAENLRKEYGIGREEQDELARPLPAAGRRRPRGRPVRRRAGPGHRPRHAAASPTSWSTATSTPVPTPPSRTWPRSGRSA